MSYFRYRVHRMDWTAAGIMSDNLNEALEDFDTELTGEGLDADSAEVCSSTATEDELVYTFRAKVTS